MSRSLPQKALTSIVAIDKNGAIGCQNALPWRLKSDLAFFRKTTTGNTVIMGRKTRDSIGCCLPNRRNLVLSHSYDLFDSTPDCRLVHSISEALTEAESSRASEIFVIGGAATYAQFAHLVDRYLVTIVDHAAKEADAYLSQSILDNLQQWPSKELAFVSAAPDQDEFDFRVVELFAPDADSRRAERASIVANFKTQSRKQTTKRSKAVENPYPNSQVAFGF